MEKIPIFSFISPAPVVKKVLNLDDDLLERLVFMPVRIHYVYESTEWGMKKKRKNSRFTGNFHAQLLLSGLNTGWYNSDYFCPCTQAGNT